MTTSTMTLLLRVVGASHLVLALGHIFIWRRFGWSHELGQVSPLTARVFAVHTFFVAFVLAALGALAAFRPDLLVTRSDLARLLLGAALLFWALRMFAQPVIFDPVLLRGSRYRMAVRVAALLTFATYVYVYAWAFAAQLG